MILRKIPSTFASRPDYPKSSRGFSLVELLVVIAIIAILSALTFATLGSSGQLVSAGTKVVDLASQARENSISKNTMTALLLITGSTNNDWNNRTFVIAQLDASSTTWTQISKFEMLPQGTLVDLSQSTFTNPSNFIYPPTLNYQGVAINSSNSRYQIFLPDGSLQTKDSTTMLYLVTGHIGTDGTSVVYTGKIVGGKPSNYFQVTVNSYTGLSKVDRP